MKTTNTHSPAPWQLGGNYDEVAIYDPSQTKLATIERWHGSIEDRDQSEANARLIAAAPELLEALRSVDSAMRSHFGGAWDGIAGCCGPNYAQQVIATAIAKATA